jgi:uncharacterized lipoprotein YddW (UPF0748 family)
MNKRDFIKTISAGAIGTIALLSVSWGCFGPDKKHRLKNWAWVHPVESGEKERDKEDEEWKKLLANLKRWEIDAVLLLTQSNDLLEKVLPIAEQTGIELHSWIIALNWPDKATMTEHPGWYVVNGNGDSSVDKPAYVDDYNWLCPGNPEVREFMKKRVSDLCGYDGLAGIHLDYIRYPDVVLAPFHRPQYYIPQDDLVHPYSDYCYCDHCRNEFKKIAGVDPLTIPDQATNQAWLKFRLDNLTGLVDELYEIVHRSGKMLTAAVFATPELSIFRVRQDWVNWKLDSVMPMIYHRYEARPVEWIGTATREGVEALSGKIPLYSGVHLFHLTPEELGLATKVSLKAGAAGITLFPGNKMDEEYWRYIDKAIKSG